MNIVLLSSINPQALAIVVRENGMTWREALRKTVECLKRNIPVVILLDPESVTAIIHRDTALPVTFTAEQDLVIPDVLPGFTVNVGSLFA